jgi:hypothetical protein
VPWLNRSAVGSIGGGAQHAENSLAVNLSIGASSPRTVAYFLLYSEPKYATVEGEFGVANFLG